MNEQKPFLIIGLPRSRTCWLSNYFSTGGVICYHERLLDFTISELYNSITPQHGNSDSSLCLYPNEVLKMEEEGLVRIVVVDRNVQDCLKSLEAAYKGLDVDPHQIIASAIHGFEIIKRFTKGVVVSYNQLDDLLPMIHNFLTPSIHYNLQRHRLLMDMNVTQDIKKKLNYASVKLKKDIANAILQQNPGNPGIR